MASIHLWIPMGPLVWEIMKKQDPNKTWWKHILGEDFYKHRMNLDDLERIGFMLPWSCNCGWVQVHSTRSEGRGFWDNPRVLHGVVRPFLVVFLSPVCHTLMWTHKHTIHIPAGSTAFPLIICSGCHSNPCSQVPSWTSFRRHQNFFLHCSHWRNRGWMGWRWLKEWPPARAVEKGPSETPDQLQVGPRWRKAAHVFGVAHQAKVRLYVEPSLWTPQGAGLQEARMAVSRASAAGTQVPACTHVLSLSTFWLAGLELDTKPPSPASWNIQTIKSLIRFLIKKNSWSKIDQCFLLSLLLKTYLLPAAADLNQQAA